MKLSLVKDIKKKVCRDIHQLIDGDVSAAKASVGCRAEEIKLHAIAILVDEMNKKLDQMKDGQCLSMIIRLDIVNRDGTLKDEGNPRQSEEIRSWRRKVVCRDRQRCVECGSKNDLHAHHIKDWANHPDLRFSVDNGVTLCVDCHALKHPERASLIVSHRNKKREAKDGQRKNGTAYVSDAGDSKEDLLCNSSRQLQGSCGKVCGCRGTHIQDVV